MDYTAWDTWLLPHVLPVVRTICRHTPKKGTLLDIGANIGLVTQLVLCQRPDISATLFEPVQDYYLEARKRLRRSARLYAFGLSNTTQKMQIYRHPENLGWNTLVAEKTTKNMVKEEIQVREYDSTPGLPTQASFIKIDVEGWEWAVILGMRKTLKAMQPKPVILMEVAWGIKHPFYKQECAMFAFLKKLGYTQTRACEQEKTVNMLFLPK